ncbi:MAG: hypothetical protein QM644_00140 [Mobilitalea sp.]
MEVKNLGEVIEFNSSFKTAINLYLSLNKEEKVLNYIPTKSSVHFMDGYLQAVLGNKEHATLLVGPYGKGKSHLLLVILAILSMERTEGNNKIIGCLKNKIKNVKEIGNRTATDIEKAWKKKKYLPVIINYTKGDLSQAFLAALNDALKRDNLIDIAPDTYYSEALRRIDEWEKDYPDTYKSFLKELKSQNADVSGLRVNLKQFSNAALILFKEIYPRITAGSTFNPLAASDALPLYKSVSEKLVEDYNYSGIYIVFDEFSKFIEGLDGSNVGNAMKLLQDMCELASESSNEQIFITMVAHKSIKEYGKYISTEIINAFTGIEGRIVEKFFVTSSKNNYELIRNAIVKEEHKLNGIPKIACCLSKELLYKYYELPAFRSNFEERDFDSIILKGCYPLNPIASYLLLNVSEKVAQNERTLFTFISNDEPHSMARFVSEHDPLKGWTIDADLIYDYFNGLFKKDITNELVHNLWLGAEYALSKCDTLEEKKLIKALAIISIVNKNDEIPANEKYLSLAASLADGNTTINALVEKQIIYKKSSLGSYVFKTRAGSELKAELKKQRALKEDAKVKYANVLQAITGKYFVIPRKYNAKNVMTRYFKHEFMEVDAFLSINSADAFFNKNDLGDGKVITLYSFSKTKQIEVREHIKQLNCQRLVVVSPKKAVSGEKALKDFEILQEIRANQTFINNNEILKKEIPLLEEDIVKEIEDIVAEVYADADVKVLFIKKEKIEYAVSEEQAVGECCKNVFVNTPLINNEIINRSTITTAQTKKARINIIDAILNHKDDEEFYSGTNQEATVYRALFCGTGITKKTPDANIAEIIDLINEFIDSCCEQKIYFTKIMNTLTSAPYGMRAGVIPIYFAYVLSNRREDLVVYFADMEVQLSAEIIVNMCEQPDIYALFVSKEDLFKETYINNLNDLFSVEDNRSLTENRIKNIVICMQRWFRGLPQIARNIAGITEYGNDERQQSNMKAMKKMLQKVELNPYEILFVDVLNKFEINDLTEAFELIKRCKEAFDGYFDWSVKRTVDAIYEIYGGQRKLDLFHVLKEWYDRQSDYSKKGLHSGGLTNLLSCIEKLDVKTDTKDEVVASKVVKAVTNVYLENWLDNAYEDFVSELNNIKLAIEHIKEEKAEGKLFLSFTGSKGNKIEHYYEKVDEGTGTILRNIIDDTIDEYDDLSVNDRVGILLEMIEKIIG